MPFILAITGGSGSGKTFIAKALRALLPVEASILSFDSYYRDQSELPILKRELLNYDDPSMLDKDLFLEHLDALRHGKEILVPTYDFATHTRKGLPKVFKPTPVIIVEGIFALEIDKKNYDFSVYIDADDDVRLARRILRDMDSRGRTAESVIKQYLTFVKPSHTKFVAPKKEVADFIFLNNETDGINEKTMAELLKHLII